MKLHLRLCKDILSLTFVILVSLCSVMFMFRILGYAEYIFSSSDALISVLMFIVFLLPAIFKIALPISVFAACVIVFLRMSGDRELEAWVASGVNVVSLGKVPTLIGLVAMVLSLLSALYLEPLSRQEFRKFKWMSVRRGVETLVENRLHEGTFLTDLFRMDGFQLTLRLDKILPDRHHFKGVFLTVSDAQDKTVYFVKANQGSLKKEDTFGFADYVFTMEDGVVYSPGEKKETANQVPTTEIQWDIFQFKQAKFSLLNLFNRQFDPGALGDDDLKSMEPGEYLSALKKMRDQDSNWRKNTQIMRDHSYFYEQIAFPLGCFFLPVLGVCLGMQDPRRKQVTAYFGVLLCLGIFFGAMALGAKVTGWGYGPPSSVVWTTLIVCVVMSAIMLRWRYKHPFSLGFIEFIRGRW